MDEELARNVWGLVIGAGLGTAATLWLRRKRKGVEPTMQRQIAQLEQTKYAWEQFASHAIPLIPVLIRQITTVIEQTERAAMDLLLKIRSISERAQKQAVYDVSSARMMEPVMDVKIQAEGLASDVSSIVMAMQFQDITRQKLEHVMRPLLQMKIYKESLVSNPNAPELAKSLNLFEEVERSYTMETERMAHRHAMEVREHVGVPVLSSAKEEDENVTLF